MLYSLENSQDSMCLDVSKMIKMIKCMQTTNQLLEDLYITINNLGNLIALDNVIHAMFDKRILTLTLLIINPAPI